MFKIENLQDWFLQLCIVQSCNFCILIKNRQQKVSQTGVLKNEWGTLSKLLPSDARNLQQLFRVEKM